MKRNRKYRTEKYLERRRMNYSLKVIILFNYLNERRKRIVFDVLKKYIAQSIENSVYLTFNIISSRINVSI